MKFSVLVLAAALLPLAGAAPALAQSDDDRRAEVGVGGSLLTSYRGGATGSVGGRGGYMFNDYVGGEIEAQVFPDTVAGLVVGGVKVGKTFDRVGVFAKLRPGAMFDGDFRDDAAFALDAGGVLEFYPSKRTTLRFDAGNLTIARENTTSNVFQASVSFGWRF
jgi:hypothetical protein